MTQQIVILAAGKGTRMGVDIPKVLLPLHDKPVVTHLLEEIKAIPQETAPVVVVGFQEQLVKDTLGSDYVYVTQFDQLGTAHAVLSAKQAVTAENFIVLYGDMPSTTSESLLKLIDLHNANQGKVSMFTAILPNFEDQYSHFFGYGRIIRNKKGRIIKIIEQKDCTDAQRQITEVNPGIYMFNSSWLWEKLSQIGDHNAQHEFYLTDIVEMAIADKQAVYSLPIAAEEVYGINNPSDLEFARSLPI